MALSVPPDAREVWHQGVVGDRAQQAQESVHDSVQEHALAQKGVAEKDKVAASMTYSERIAKAAKSRQLGELARNARNRDEIARREGVAKQAAEGKAAREAYNAMKAEKEAIKQERILREQAEVIEKQMAAKRAREASVKADAERRIAHNADLDMERIDKELRNADHYTNVEQMKIQGEARKQAVLEERAAAARISEDRLARVVEEREAAARARTDHLAEIKGEQEHEDRVRRERLEWAKLGVASPPTVTDPPTVQALPEEDRRGRRDRKHRR